MTYYDKEIRAAELMIAGAGYRGFSLGLIATVVFAALTQQWAIAFVFAIMTGLVFSLSVACVYWAENQ